MDQNTPQESVNIEIDNPQETVQETPKVEPAQQTDLSTSNTQESTANPAASPAPNPVGRPCGLCKNKDEFLAKTQAYIESGKGDKPKVLFLIELALTLGIHRDTLWEWVYKKNEEGSLEHPEFSDKVKEVEIMQELSLQRRILGRYNPTGAIFLLKTKHGYIESEKRILAGDAKEPLEIVITEERKRDE